MHTVDDGRSRAQQTVMTAMHLHLDSVAMMVDGATVQLDRRVVAEHEHQADQLVGRGVVRAG